MTARSRPEDIEYISRLKFGSQFSYTPDHHTKEDIDVDNYFHNVSRHAQKRARYGRGRGLCAPPWRTLIGTALLCSGLRDK